MDSEAFVQLQEPPANLGPASNPGQGPSLVPIPSSSAIPAFKSSSTLTPVVCDERAIGRLLETVLHRSGLSIEEVSRRMGVTSNTIRQYLAGRRNRPSLLWFVKLANLCGTTVSVQFPDKA